MMLRNDILLPTCADTVRSHLVRLGVDNVGCLDVFDSVTSTNDYLLHKEVGDEIAVCIAEQQTQGRGRFGHTWWSPPGNIYLSLSYPLAEWKSRYATLGLWLLIAIAKLFEQLKCSGVQLKWPNDICVQDRKLGGILIEQKSGQAHRRLVVGVGLNVAASTTSKTMDAPREIHWQNLISIIPDRKLSRDELAAQIIVALTTTLAGMENNVLTNLPAIWSRYDAMRNRVIRFTCNSRSDGGVAKGIDSQGRLIVTSNGKTRHLHDAHVSEIRL